MKERACLFDPNITTLICYPEDEEYDDVQALGSMLHHIDYEYEDYTEDVIVLDGTMIDQLRENCGDHFANFVEAHEYAHYWLKHFSDTRPTPEKELEADLFASMLVPELNEIELIICTRQGNYSIEKYRELIPKFLEYKRTVLNEPKPIPEPIS